MPTGATEKKKQTYIWIAVIVLVFGILSIPALVKKITEGTVVDNKRLSGESLTGTPLAYVVQDGERRRVPEFELLDQDSLPFSSAEMKGRVWVLDFFFTTCPTICPRMSTNLRAIQDAFEEEELGIISITINPRYDTPAMLREYAAKFGAGPQWKFLSGEQEYIHRLARQGFYMYAAEGDQYRGGFEHSGLFALIDREGFIRSRQDEFDNPLIYYRGSVLPEDGTDSDGEPEQIGILIEDIKKLLKE